MTPRQSRVLAANRPGPLQRWPPTEQVVEQDVPELVARVLTAWASASASSTRTVRVVKSVQPFAEAHGPRSRVNHRAPHLVGEGVPEPGGCLTVEEFGGGWFGDRVAAGLRDVPHVRDPEPDQAPPRRHLARAVGSLSVLGLAPEGDSASPVVVVLRPALLAAALSSVWGSRMTGARIWMPRSPLSTWRPSCCQAV
jgi:hypothetical protein